MNEKFDYIIDECLDRITRGQSVEACLDDYPEYSEQLKPLLQAILQTKNAYTYTPSASAKKLARQRFNAALDKLEQRRREKQSLFTWLFPRPRVLATIAVATVILIAGYFGLQSVFNDGADPIQVNPLPNPQGNFVFLISDEENAIGDFQTLNISIAEIGLQLGDEADQWIEFNPEVEVVDLTLLPGDKAQAIWRGDVPEGQYTKVFIHVSSVQGILKETKHEVEVKLPSQKLQISKAFDVSADTVTNFIYDVTVIEAGKSGQYILKPQVGQSGADQRFEEIKGSDQD
jgi:hypothetical protein